MIRNLLKSAFILALLTLFFWLTDEKSQLNFTLNGTVYALSIPEAAIGLFAAGRTSVFKFSGDGNVA